MAETPNHSGPWEHVVRCFWHGPFSPYEAPCLSSFVAAGVAVELFSEAPIAGLPVGVTGGMPAKSSIAMSRSIDTNSTGRARRFTPIISAMRCSNNPAAGGSIPM